jgi:hypothetical protein
MKTIKINFSSFWPNLNKEDNFFTNLLKKKYNVVISNKPDYVFFSVFDKEKSSSYKINKVLKKHFHVKLYGFIKKLYYNIRRRKMKDISGDFIKIYYSCENAPFDMSKCDWAFSYQYEDKINHPNYFRLPGYFVWFLKSHVSKKTFFSKNKTPKKKFCNFIYSNDVKIRNDFFKKLNNYKKIDSYGKSMNNLLFPKSKKDNYEQKLDILKNYKFTIAFENSSDEGYTTEKIIHPMLTGSIPIYWGNPRIGEDFNVKSFINCHDYNNFDEVIERIKEIDNDDKLYEEILKEPWLKEKNKWFDDERLLNKLVEIIESKNE